MRSEHLGGRVVLHGGDSRDVLKGIADCSIDSVVTDPPYALVSIVKRFGGPNAAPAKGNDAYMRASAGFMGANWDVGDTAFAVEFWAEIMRVLKPGGHVVAFSGTRTYHRLAVAIEDAGFEIRDQLAWVYGSGFPKSHDVSKAIDKAAGAERAKVRVDNPRIANMPTANTGAGRPWLDAALERGFHEKAGDVPVTAAAAAWQGWGTALKPAWEPIVMARKPLVDTVAANVLEHGTGALNIDECRIESDESLPIFDRTGGATDHVAWEMGTARLVPHEARGRWPANIVHDGSDEVVGCFPDAPGQQRAVGPQHGAKDSVNVFGDYGPRDLCEPRNDSGSAARYFYSAQENDTEWLVRNLNLSHADIAEFLSYPPNGAVCSALSDVVTSALPVEAHCDLLCPERFTSATPSELRAIAEAATAATRSIVEKSLLGLPLESITASLNHARYAVQRTPIDTITITVSHWTSDGSADPVTFSITPTNSVVGAPVSAPSTARLFYSGKADKQDRIGSKHPTVKPVDLMQWLCRLVTPPGGTVLDPFAGSGSTGEAAWREGFQCVLIEREPEYQADITERLRLADKGPMERRQRAIKQADDAGPLFGANDNAPPPSGERDGRSTDTSPIRTNDWADRPQALGATDIAA